MRRKRLYYCAFVFKTYAQQLAIQNCDGEKVSHPCAPIKTKIWKKKKQKSEETKWTEANCVRSRVGTFSRTPPRNCEQLANVIQNKKRKKIWKRVHVKSKKNLNVIQIGCIPLFREKKGGTKQKQNKKKEQSSGSVFAVTVRNGCVLFWQCLLLTYRKEPRVREK